MKVILNILRWERDRGSRLEKSGEGCDEPESQELENGAGSEESKERERPKKCGQKQRGGSPASNLIVKLIMAA